MSRIFDPENKFWSAISKVADVTCMSFLWTITSLPLVTMGAATTAFYSYTMRQVRDTEGGILSGFFSAFRKHFKKATLLWLLEAAGIAFFAADLVGVWNFYLLVGGVPAIVLGALVLCLTALFLGCTFYVWEILPEDLQQQLGSALCTETDAEGKTVCIAVDMTGSRFVAGTGTDTDPRVEHTYYLFVPESAPHTEQIAEFLRYAFRLD